MTSRTYTIGRFARHAGVTVKRVRFYADQKLLPPSARTERGYRLFTDEDLVRLDLICTLREAGFGLDDIRRILGRPVALRDVLHLRLKAVEAQIESQTRIVRMLRAVLASPDPTMHDLRRIHAMTNLSQTERRAVIEQFFGQFSGEASINPKHVDMLSHAATHRLPETLAPDQIGVWMELSDLMDDPAFIIEMRAKLAKMTENDDKTVMRAGLEAALKRVRAALAANAAPDAETGQHIAEPLIAHYARAHGMTVEDAERLWIAGFTHAGSETSVDRYWRLMKQLWEPADLPTDQSGHEMKFLWTSVGAWRRSKGAPLV